MSIFDFDNYKDYLKEHFKTSGEGRGGRTKLAKYLDCQSGFISHVFNSYTNFSLEHAILVNEFLRHDEEQGEFFLLLVQLERAGSFKLKNFFQTKVNKIKKSKRRVSGRLKKYAVVDEIDAMKKRYQKHHPVFISALKKTNLNELKTKIAKQI